MAIRRRGLWWLLALSAGMDGIFFLAASSPFLLAQMMGGGGLPGMDPGIMKEMVLAVPVHLTLLIWLIQVLVKAGVIVGMGKALNLKVEFTQALGAAGIAGIPGFFGVLLTRSMAGSLFGMIGLGLVISLAGAIVLFAVLMTMLKANFGQAAGIFFVGIVVALCVGWVLGKALTERYTAPAREKLRQQLQGQMTQPRGGATGTESGGN